MNARVGSLDESLLNKYQDLESQIQDLEDEVGGLRDRIANLEVDIKEINREKRKFVTETEIGEIESYMELMNPINSNFATKKQVEELIKENRGLTEEEVEKIIDRKLKNKEDESMDELE